MCMKTCLVLEGGALRGIYTAGVLDEMQKDSLSIDTIIGVSMGSLVGINYVSNQPGRALRYNLTYCRDRRYISFHSFFKTGNLVNKNFAFYEIPNRLDPFDYDAFDSSSIEFLCTVTNVETGCAEYIPIKNSRRDVEYLRAGGAMPGVSKIVEIDGKKYLDGGIADSIPVEEALLRQYDRIIVVLTQPIDYRKKNSSLRGLCSIYRKYPKFVQTLKSRNERYNKTVEEILKLEEEKKIFVIRPSVKIPIKRVEKNPKIIQAQYDLGCSDYRNRKSALEKYLKDDKKGR